MKNKFAGLLLLPVLAIALLCMGCGSNAADKPEKPAEVTPAPAVEQASGDAAEDEAQVLVVKPDPPIMVYDVNITPQEKELSPAAVETCAYLLLIQSILDEDEAALLEVASMMQNTSLPPSIWLDGGVWLMSRKSANAVPFLEYGLKVYPEDMSLNLLQAEALGDHGMASRGVELMRAYLQKHPDALDARLELALLLVKDKQFDAAQELLSTILPKERTPLVDYYQARALMGMGKRSEAIPYLKKAVRGMPDFVEGLAELAFAQEQEGNLRDARSTYEKLQKLNFSPQDVALRLVNISLKLNQPERAVQYIRQGPDSLPFKLTAANLLMDSRHYLQAETILKQVAAGKNAPPEVYLLLADLVYEQRHNLPMALSWLDKIPPSSPAAIKASLVRLQLMAEAGKISEAIREGQENLQKQPDIPELWDFNIRLLAKAKKMPEALAAARDAVNKWPENEDLNFLLGSLLDESGKKHEALEVMENILKHNPDNFQALNYVGYTLAEQGRDLQRALELLLKADSLSPDKSYIVDSLAWALFKSGKGAEALQHIRRAVNLDDVADAAIWEHYGDIAYDQGQKEEARKAYRKALELKPANMEDVRGKLSRI